MYMHELQTGFDVRLDRLEAMAHGSLQLGYDIKADVKVLRAEVLSWKRTVSEIERKVA